MPRSSIGSHQEATDQGSATWVSCVSCPRAHRFLGLGRTELGIEHVLLLGVAFGGKADDDRQGLAVFLLLMASQLVGVGIIGTGQRDVTEQKAQEHEFLEDGCEGVSSGMVCLRPPAPQLPMPCRSARSSLASTKTEKGENHQNDDDGADDIDDVVH